MNEVDKKLILKFLEKGCTAEEALRVERLLNDPEVRKFIRELSLEEWERPVNQMGEHSPNLENWKAKANAYIHSDLRRNSNVQHPIIKLLSRRYAAVWLAVLSISLFGVWKLRMVDQHQTVAIVQKINKQGIPAAVQLPDSSTIYLAAGSRIQYPARFTGDTREISLVGEAFFDVKRNPEKPFIIHTGDLRTTVLGTSFKITAIPNRPMAVAVATGKVDVSRKDKQLALLVPGHKVTWNAVTHQALVEETSIDELDQWKNGDLVFDRLEMKYIAEELTNRYGVEIEFVDKEVMNNRVTGTFPATMTINTMLETLAVAGKFKYEEIQEKKIKIY